MVVGVPGISYWKKRTWSKFPVSDVHIPMAKKNVFDLPITEKTFQKKVRSQFRCFSFFNTKFAGG